MAYYSKITTAGAAKQAAAIASSSALSLATLSVGDSGGNSYDPTGNETALVNQRHSVAINQMAQDVNNPSNFHITAVLPPEVGGWYIREIGVWDSDGVLILIAKVPETYKPLLAEGSGKTLTVEVVGSFNSSALVTLSVDATKVYATRAYAIELADAAQDNAVLIAQTAHQTNANTYAVGTGSATAIVGEFTPEITALQNGTTLMVVAPAKNTVIAPTFTPNSGIVPAKAIVRPDLSSLFIGDILAGQLLELSYNQTVDKWVLLNPNAGMYAGGYSNIFAINASIALTTEHVGALIGITGTGVVATLPDAATVKPGSSFTLLGTTTVADFTVNTSNSQNIIFKGSTYAPSMVVSAGQVVKFTRFGLSWVAEYHGHPKGQVRYTANGTFVVPPGITTLYFSACAGGGGGGAGGGNSSTLIGSGGGGGGAGQFCYRVPYSVTPGQSIPITIGAAGVGGSAVAGANGNAGTAGGDTVVGSLFTLTGGGGGGGGYVNTTTTAGGSPGTGYPYGSFGSDTGIAMPSGSYMYGTSTSPGGAGGSGPYGGGGGAGRGGIGGGAGGQNAFGFGAGGGGGGGSYATTASTLAGGPGRAGAPGMVLIEW